MELKVLKSHEELLEKYKISYEQDLEHDKIVKIKNKIFRSKAIEKLIKNCIIHEELPSCHKLASVLLSTRHFIFANSATIAFASILILNLIINEFKNNNIYISDRYAVGIVKGVIKMND